MAGKPSEAKVTPPPEVYFSISGVFLLWGAQEGYTPRSTPPWNFGKVMEPPLWCAADPTLDAMRRREPLEVE